MIETQNLQGTTPLHYTSINNFNKTSIDEKWGEKLMEKSRRYCRFVFKKKNRESYSVIDCGQVECRE